MSTDGGFVWARLVVNADDFGLSPCINDGIVQAHSLGIVTATSLMAVGGGFAHAVSLCADLPFLDVGVHLTLVAERPLLPAASLTGPDGRFPPDAAALVRRCLRGAIRLDEVEAEWAAQIERVLAAGIRPSHLDSHQHVHVLPGLAAVAQRLARRYGIGRLRLPLEVPPWAWPRGIAGLLRLGGLAALWATWGLARLAGARAVTRPSLCFLGFLAGGRLDEERLLRLVASMRPATDYELMCHPGLRPQVSAVADWGYRHEDELLALTSPRVRSALLRRGVSLVRFSQL